MTTFKPGFAPLGRCLVTGGAGFVGQRLVEMLLERGASYVVSFDILPKAKFMSNRNSSMADSNQEKFEYFEGDITKYEDVFAACSKKIDILFHIAALVGPYHAKEAYFQVNTLGSQHILTASKECKIKRIVMSSSPSTRFPYPDPNIVNLTENDLFVINKGDFAPVFLQPYAETKAMGEKLIREACGGKKKEEKEEEKKKKGRKEGKKEEKEEEEDLLTIAVAPHQVYGPRDGLFLPSLLATAASGKLRIFGKGDNLISFCHVDNYCHGLILGAEALYPNSPALG